MTGKPIPAKPVAKASRRAPRSRRGTLLIIAGLLAASGAIRLGNGAGSAFANADSTQTGTVDPIACEPDGGTMAMLAALKDRETRLAVREAAYADRSQTLAIADVQITEKLAALVAAEEKLAKTMVQADQAAETDIAKLTTVYENMKPKEAAPLFEEMAPEFAAGFLARMRPDAAAAIMAGLEPKSAYTISVLLAGRNALVPKD